SRYMRWSSNFDSPADTRQKRGDDETGQFPKPDRISSVTNAPRQFAARAISPKDPPVPRRTASIEGVLDCHAGVYINGYQIAWDGLAVWINGADGSSRARFRESRILNTGHIDIHHDIETQFT